MWYGYAADLLVFVHVLYVGYVVLGQAAIILAAPFRWRWARNPWFRFSHLAAIGYVAYEAVMGIRCPLTVWEEQLREAGGQAVQSGQTFMGRLFHNLLFWDQPEYFFNILHVEQLLGHFSLQLYANRDKVNFKVLDNGNTGNGFKHQPLHSQHFVPRITVASLFVNIRSNKFPVHGVGRD